MIYIFKVCIADIFYRFYSSYVNRLETIANEFEYDRCVCFPDSRWCSMVVKKSWERHVHKKKNLLVIFKY